LAASLAFARLSSTANSSPPPGEHVVVAQPLADRVRDLHERAITGGVTARVVELLKAVEIDQAHGAAGVLAAVGRKVPVDRLQEPAPVRPPGQTVEPRQPRSPRFSLPCTRHVDQRHQSRGRRARRRPGAHHRLDSTHHRGEKRGSFALRLTPGVLLTDSRTVGEVGDLAELACSAP